ncbi:unnamed protein product [Pseudo-nitzschia multistriata]|uniref:Uncharacterized protein n=1 Tax=Pseudo-nitzschia multistriata TaxID=183589 RepID=A0A448ZBL8_9STRA|nr:unnamed protein product [Pseudo-nitzschia multistriata]
MTTQGHVLATVLLLSEIVGGGRAFSTPVGFASFQQRRKTRSASEGHTNGDGSAFDGRSLRSALFAAQYFHDDDQWSEDVDAVYQQELFDYNPTQHHHHQQQQQQQPSGFNPEFGQAPEQEQTFELPSKRAVFGGAALGTMLVINNAVGMSVGAEPAIAEPQEPSSEVPHQLQTSVQSYSAITDAQPEVTLPYLEEQIKTAEEAIAQAAFADESSASVAVGEEMQAPETTFGYSTPVVASTETAAPETIATQASPAYQSSASVVASVEVTAPKPVADVAKTDAPSPSFVRYTREHMPEWIERGQRVYDAAAPKVVAGGTKIAAEFDKRVTPMIVEKEHELLGDANSAVLDKTLSNVAYAGKMMAGMVGKVVSLGIEGGVQVAQATPKVIKAGQQVYNTIDQKIMPEVADTTRKMKTIVDKTVPEVAEAGMHAYDTIMPEVMNAERQVATTVKNGIDMAMPTLKEIEARVMPVLNDIEHDVLGDEGAYMLEKTVADAAQQGKNALDTVARTVPEVTASVQKTVDGVAYTGQTISRALPVIAESGKQTYESVDRGISDAIATTQDIASDIDRAAGKTMNAIEDNMASTTRAIDSAIPTVLETGRRVAVTGVEVAKTVETGGKALMDDIAGFVEDNEIDNTIESATKRFAKTQPVYRDFTASVNDPNDLGKL